MLQPCPEHLHQVSGALRMVGLPARRASARRSKASFAGMRRGAARRRQTIGVIDRAVLALKEFVERPGARPAQRAAAPVTRCTASCRRCTARAAVSEKDLFFPDLCRAGAGAPEPEEPARGRAACRSCRRSARASSAACWPGCASSPPGWRTCARRWTTLHQVAPQLPEPRALWWAALGAARDR